MANWASNGMDTGGSGAYLPGTQGVQYILANFAHTGDTITLPAGTFNWGLGTGSTPGTMATTNVNISVTIQGIQPGQTGNVAPESSFQTIINNNLVSGNLLFLSAPSNGHITLAYICFKQIVNNGGGHGYAVVLDRADINAQGALVTSPYTCLVHDCFFDGNGWFAAYMINVICIGVVIWYCTILTAGGNPSGGGIENLPDKYGLLLNWSTPDTMGGSATALGVGDTAAGWAGVAGLNNTYIEDCFIANGTSTIVDIGSNGRAVVRHCIIQDGLIASHGSTGVDSIKHLEVYANTFKNVNAVAWGLGNWVGMRSGACVVTNNSFDLISSGTATMAFFVEQVSRTNFGGPGSTVYPATRQIGTGWSQANATGSTSQSGTVTNGSTTVTGLANTSALFKGQQVSGTNIPSGCLVNNILSNTSISITSAATGSGTVTLTFTGIPFGFPPALVSSGFPTSMGYGQAFSPCYIWNNTGPAAPTRTNTRITEFTPDTFGNNLTINSNIFFNQQQSNFSSAAVASLSATFPGTQNANVVFPGSWKNDLLLCMLSWSGSGVTVSVADTAGNKWTQIGSTFTSAGSGTSQAIFAAINSVTTGTATVTASFFPNVTVLGMNIADYAGNWPSISQLNNFLSLPTTDGTATQNSSASSSSLTTGTITTTSQSGGNDLIIAWVQSQSTPTGVSAGFNQQAFDSTNHFGFFDNIGTGFSQGPFATPGTFGMTATTTAPWTASMVAFQAMPFLLMGRDFIYGTAMPGWMPFFYPHPLRGTAAVGPSVSGNVLVTGSVSPTQRSASNGLTAAADASIVRTIVGASSGGYVLPANNWVSLYSTQFGPGKDGAATEWIGGSYVRQAMGANASGWTIAAYANGIGVVFNNTNFIGFPGVLTTQTLFSLGFCDALSGGNIDLFIDIILSITVSAGLSVTLPASTGAVFTTY